MMFKLYLNGQLTKIMHIFETKSDNRDYRSLIFSTLLAASISSVILSPIIIYGILSIIYVEYLFHRIFVQKDIKANRHSYVFLVSAAATGVLVLYHSNQITDGGDFKRTLELASIFCLIHMIFDCIGYNLKRFKIPIGVFAKTGIALVLAFAAARFVYAYNAGYINSWADVTSLKLHHSNLLRINPNHADDLLTIIILSSTWFLLLARKARIRIPLLVTGIIIWMLACGYFIYQASSFGGYIGLMSAGVLVAIYWYSCLQNSTFHKLKKVSIVILITATMALAFSWFASDNRLFNITNQVWTILLSETNGANIYNICDGQAEDAKPVLGEKLSEDLSTSYRYALYVNGLEIWLQKPWLGHGAYDREQFVDAYPSLDKCVVMNFPHVHSLYLDLLIRGGVAMLLIYFLAYMIALKRIHKQITSSPDKMAILMIPVLFFFVYLGVENLFDLTYLKVATLKANLLSMCVIWSVTAYILRERQNL